MVHRLEDSSVYVLRHDGCYVQMVQDERLSWPDSFALDERGDLLVTTTHMLPLGRKRMDSREQDFRSQSGKD